MRRTRVFRRTGPGYQPGAVWLLNVVIEERMANTASARKRIRQTVTRTARNQARKSRMRTFVKKVETAIASGDKSAAAAGADGSPAGDAAGIGQRRDPRQHRGPQAVPPVGPDQGAAERLITGTGIARAAVDRPARARMIRTADRVVVTNGQPLNLTSASMVRHRISE